jgi:hypothetical protein
MAFYHLQAAEALDPTDPASARLRALALGQLQAQLSASKEQPAQKPPASSQ